MLRGPFGLELLDVFEVLLHVRQNFFFFNDTGYFLLLLALDRFHALPLDLDGGGFLFCGFLQRSFLARTQTSGPLVPLRLLHQVVSATFHECNFILPPLLEELVSTVRKFGALRASPKSFLVSRLELLDGQAAVQAGFEGPGTLGVEALDVAAALASSFAHGVSRSPPRPPRRACY